MGVRAVNPGSWRGLLLPSWEAVHPVSNPTTQPVTSLQTRSSDSPVSTVPTTWRSTVSNPTNWPDHQSPKAGLTVSNVAVLLCSNKRRTLPLLPTPLAPHFTRHSMLLVFRNFTFHPTHLPSPPNTLHLLSPPLSILSSTLSAQLSSIPI